MAPQASRADLDYGGAAARGRYPLVPCTSGLGTDSCIAPVAVSSANTSHNSKNNGQYNGSSSNNNKLTNNNNSTFNISDMELDTLGGSPDSQDWMRSPIANDGLGQDLHALDLFASPPDPDRQQEALHVDGGGEAAHTMDLDISYTFDGLPEEDLDIAFGLDLMDDEIVLPGPERPAEVTVAVGGGSKPSGKGVMHDSEFSKIITPIQYPNLALPLALLKPPIHTLSLSTSRPSLPRACRTTSTYTAPPEIMDVTFPHAQPRGRRLGEATSLMGAHVGKGLITLRDIPLPATSEAVYVCPYKGITLSLPLTAHQLEHSDYILSIPSVYGTVTVDGAGGSCWGSLINDAFDAELNNCSPRRAKSGSADEIHIMAILPVAANSELCMPYGREYWLQRLHLLSYEDLRKCLLYYDITRSEFGRALGWVLLYDVPLSHLNTAAPGPVYVPDFPRPSPQRVLTSRLDRYLAQPSDPGPAMAASVRTPPPPLARRTVHFDLPPLLAAQVPQCTRVPLWKKRVKRITSDTPFPTVDLTEADAEAALNPSAGREAQTDIPTLSASSTPSGQLQYDLTSAPRPFGLGRPLQRGPLTVDEIRHMALFTSGDLQGTSLDGRWQLRWGGRLFSLAV